MTTHTQTLGPHLTFDEQAEAGLDAFPCACWSVGRGEITGVPVASLLHPAEYRDGAQSAFDEAYDL